MKNTAINVTVENVEEVVEGLKTLVLEQASDGVKLERWIYEQVEALKGEPNAAQRLRALDYIKDYQALMLDAVTNGPVYVCFGAETNVYCLLNYAPELIQPNNFAKSYDAALRKLQQTFKNCGYEFSEVIFTSIDDGGITLNWKTKYPIVFQDVLDYPKSLMRLAALLDELNILGLDFGSSHHLIDPLSDANEGKYFVGQGFKEGGFESYGDGDCHLIQELPVEFGSFIEYTLDGSYHLSLNEGIDEESLKFVLESGYHLDGDELRNGLNGTIKSIEIING